MDIILGFIFSSIVLIISVAKGIDVLIPLVLVVSIFLLLSLKKGFTLKESVRMAYDGGKKSFIVLQIFILIGSIISSWMISGTVAAIVYYGINLINPNLFIVSAFILSAIVSLLIGTSFGTIGTVGISLMVMARAGDANIYAVAGAILSGAYFGDRCSPMSSSANLIATITGTELYKNIKNMIKTSMIPLIVSLILFTLLSLKNPMNYENSNIAALITKYFNINILVLIPAVIIIILSVLKVKVKTSMIISMISASIIAYCSQNYSVKEILEALLWGFKLPINNPLASIIKGGGIISMVKLSIIVFMSSALTGIFEGANLLESIETKLNKIKSPYKIFIATIVSSIISAMIGCTQVLAVMLTKTIMETTYRKHGLDNYRLALDLENTAIVIAPLIPWNVAVLVPLTNLQVSPKAIVYSFYLIAIPIVNFLVLYFKCKRVAILSKTEGVSS